MDSVSAFERDVLDFYTACPNARLSLGLSDGLDALPDPSLAAEQRRVERARVLQKRAEDLLALPIDDVQTQLDLELALLKLRRTLFESTVTFNNGRTTLQQTPSAAADVGNGLFLLFANDPRPPHERLRDILARLRATPQHTQGVLNRLDRPVERWTAMDQARVQGFPSLFSSLVAWARQVAWPGADDLEDASKNALTSLQSYAETLSSLPKEPNIHFGLEATRTQIAVRGIELTPEELHEIATQFLAHIRKQEHEIAQKLISKYHLSAQTTVEELQQFLATKFAVQLPNQSLDDILDRYRKEHNKLLDFIRERDLFPILPNQDLHILRTPKFMEPSIPAGAMAQPPPLREGVRKSLVYLTLREDLLPEHTELSIPIMMIHEGIPGHHLQLATAGTFPSKIRKIISALDQAEGWTTMLEDYMLDIGYMGDLTDEARFVTTRDIARIGARVAIDLFFMSGERSFLNVGVPCDQNHPDPFTAAGSLLRSVTGFVPQRVEAELNWYSQNRGYPLSYLTGNWLVHKLRDDFHQANVAQHPGLSCDRLFHKAFLEAGHMPVAALRRLFQAQGHLPSA